ncbi:MAG: hypothetical protein NC299_15255 [Lachnospiraceae bacterium]|nr:hypothetical protein [Lachnospiraceae bacterium]
MRNKDVLCEVFKGVAIAGALVSLFFAITGFIDGVMFGGLISLGVMLLFGIVYWLVASIGKIIENLNVIKNNSDVVSAYYRQIMYNQSVAQNYQQPMQSAPFPVNDKTDN